MRLLEAAKQLNAKFFKELFPDAGSDSLEDIYTSAGFDAGTLGFYRKEMELYHDRLSRYRDYEDMDELSTECGAVLDINGDNATQTNRENGRVVWVESKDTELVSIGHDLFDALELDDQIFSYIRTLAKYGDEFDELVLDKTKGVINMRYVHPSLISRVEQKSTGRLVGYLTDATNVAQKAAQSDSKKVPLIKPWRIAHARNMSNRRGVVSGDGILENVRYLWRQIRMMEMMLVIYRLSRGPDRMIHYIDVGTKTPEEAQRFVSRIRRRFKHRMWLDTRTGDFKQTRNVLSIDEDIYHPIRAGSESRIERLSGGADVSSIADVEHMRRKFSAGTRVPLDFIGGEAGGGMFSRAEVLSQQDIMFARPNARLQRGGIKGLTTVLQVHFKILGKTTSTKDFQVKMVTPSVTEDLKKYEVMEMKIRVAESMASVMVQSLEIPVAAVREILLVNIMGFSQEDTNKLLKSVPKEGGDSQGGVDMASVTPSVKKKIMDTIEKDPELSGMVHEVFETVRATMQEDIHSDVHVSDDYLPTDKDNLFEEDEDGV